MEYISKLTDIITILIFVCILGFGFLFVLIGQNFYMVKHLIIKGFDHIHNLERMAIFNLKFNQADDEDYTDDSFSADFLDKMNLEQKLKYYIKIEDYENANLVKKEIDKRNNQKNNDSSK
jgi:hypothetical protein